MVDVAAIDTTLQNLPLVVRIIVSGLVIALGIGTVAVLARTRGGLEAYVPGVMLEGIFAILTIGTVIATAGLVLSLWQLTTPLWEGVQRISPTETIVPELLLTIVILVAAQMVARFVDDLLEEFLGTYNAVSSHQREIIYRTLQIVLYLGAGAIILSIWQINLSGILVGAGVLGIVLGLAARQTLGAILAGFVLMFSRPFEIGDWVEFEDHEGIVTEITIFNTRVQTFDGEYVMIPNDQITSFPIINRTRRGQLRIEIEVGVDYDTDLETAAAVAQEAMKGCELVLNGPAPRVVMKRFDNSGIILGCRFWIDQPSARRRWRAQTAVIEEIKSAFDAESISIPFPQRTISMREGADKGMAIGEQQSISTGATGNDNGE